MIFKKKVNCLLLSFLACGCIAEEKTNAMHGSANENLDGFRDDLKDHSVIFNRVIDKKEYTRENYSGISDAINFMNGHINGFELKGIEESIIIVGASGAGKSTVTSYLVAPLNLVVGEGKTLRVKENGVNVSRIGSGKGSTTVFPIVCRMPFGVIIDCAGEGDTSGVIAQAINAYAKCKMAKGIKKIKIIFVTPQSSLGHEGQYGANFKAALDANATFLHDINYFKNSVCMIITNAERDTDEDEPDPQYAINESKKMLKNIIDGTTSTKLGNYHETLNSVIEKNILKPFLKPSSKVVNSEYKEPKIDPNQRQNIIDMINNLPYTDVPSNDFFKVPYSMEIKSAMEDAIDIVKKRMADEIKTSFVENNKSIILYSAEISQFIEYLKSIRGNVFASEPKTYIKYLSHNDYIKIKISENFIEKIVDEIIFLHEFLESLGNDGKIEQKNCLKEDWLGLVYNKDFDELCNNLLTDAIKISNKKNYVLSSCKEGLIATKSAYSESASISKMIGELQNLNEEKATIEAAKIDNTSTYYDSVEKDVLDKINKIPKKRFTHNAKQKSGKKVKVIKGTKQQKVTQNITVQESYIKEYKNIYGPKMKTIKGLLCTGVFKTEEEVIKEHSAAREAYLNPNKDCVDHTENPTFYRYSGSCNVRLYYETNGEFCYHGDSKNFVCNRGGDHPTQCPSDWFKDSGNTFVLNGVTLPKGNIVRPEEMPLFKLFKLHTSTTKEIPDGQEVVGKEPIYDTRDKPDTVTSWIDVPNEVDEDEYVDVPQYEDYIEEEKIMKKETVKEFNETKYNQTLSDVDSKILIKKTELEAYFSKNSTNGNCPSILPPIEDDNDDIKTFFEKWQKLEFISYGKLPNKVFSSVGV